MDAVAWISPSMGGDNDPPARSQAKLLIRFAWGAEVVCMLVGLLTAGMVAYEQIGTTGMVAVALAVAPFVAVAFLEFGRIPLVQGAFGVRGLPWRLFALVFILLLAFYSGENLWFGFERAFSVRIERVRRAEETASASNAKVEAIQQALNDARKQRDQISDDLAKIDASEGSAQQREQSSVGAAQREADFKIGRAQAELDRLTADRSNLVAAQAREMRSVDARCVASPDTCQRTSTRQRHQRDLAAIEQKIKDSKAELQAAMAIATQERRNSETQFQIDRKELNNQRQPLTEQRSELDRRLGTLGRELAEAKATANAANGEAEAEHGSSQPHRLAKFLYGRDDLASAQRALALFAIIAAAAISLLGSCLAALHCRVQTQKPVAALTSQERHRLSRAIRGLLTRRRKRWSVVKVIEKTIEVPKPELVLVPISLTATEQERRETLAHASAAHGGLGTAQSGA